MKHRFKIISSMCDNVYYLTLNNGEVYLCNMSETPIGLTSICNNAVELRNDLERMSERKVVISAVIATIKRHCGGYIKSVEMI